MADSKIVDVVAQYLVDQGIRMFLELLGSPTLIYSMQFITILNSLGLPSPYKQV